MFSKTRKPDAYFPQKLEAKFSEIFDYPCTAIIAPTGFGKTMAVREFVCRLNEYESNDTVVLSQIILDGEGVFFWDDFSERFEELDGKFAASMAETGLPVTPDQKRTFLKGFTGLLNSLSKNILFIIDAGSFIPDENLRNFLEYFIKGLPDNFHLLLISRQPMCNKQSLSQYYNLINQISVRDMEFSALDVENYYRSFNISSKEAQRIHSLSEGWITLISQNLKEIGNSGAGITEKHAQKIIDSMVYDPLPPNYKEFLSWIGFCKSFLPDQAEYMYPKKNAENIIADLVEKGLFIKYDESSKVYFLENCFSSCIKRKCNELTVEERNKRLIRAGDWCIKAMQNSSARQYYYQAKDFDSLMQGVGNRLFGVPYVDDDHLFISYYADCPPDIRVRYPKALFVFAKYLSNSNRKELSQKVGIEFLEAVKANTDLSEIKIKKYETMYELFLSSEQFNNLKAMYQHLKNAVKIIGNELDNFFWPETGLFEMPSILNMYHRKPGELEKEVKLFAEYNALYIQFTQGRTSGAELVMKAEAEYMAGDITSAEITIYKARFITNRVKQWGVWVSVVYLHIRIELERGNWPRVANLLEEARNADLPAHEGNVFFMSAADFSQAYVGCKLEQPNMLSSLFKTGWDSHFDTNFRAFTSISVIHAEVLLAQKEYTELIALADSYLATARMYSNLLVEIFLEIEVAIAYEKIGKRATAVSHLRNALTIAEPDNLIMPFAEFGKYISAILPLSSSGVSKGYIGNIILRAHDFQEKLDKIKRQYFSKETYHEIYHLTPQEVKIAQLAVSGYSNQEIAETLFIQESTVKTHLTHIFTKLEIEKRSQLRAFFDKSIVVDKKSDFS
jgi:LuxR family maltose regulon positive regulatory protein